MGRNPVTARERRGLLTVAAVSLLVVGCGYAMRTCRNASVPMAPPLEVMTDDGRFVTADSAAAVRVRRDSADVRKSGSRKKRKSTRSDGSKKKSAPDLPPRNFLDEEL